MKISNFKLGIGLPVADRNIPVSFFDSWVLLDKPEFVYIRPSFPNVDIARIRNDLVTQALDSGCTHLLMLDTDQVYRDSDLIAKLLLHDLDVVNGLVYRRYPPFDHLCMKWDDNEKRYYKADDEEVFKKGLVEVDATGTGCVLYKTDVFKKIKQPWFEFNVDDHGKAIGEDINFCKKLKEQGYKLFVDCSVNIGHLSTLEVNESTYRMYNMMNK